MLVKLEAHEVRWNSIDEEFLHINSYVQDFEIATIEDLQATLDWVQGINARASKYGHIIRINAFDTENAVLDNSEVWPIHAY